METTAVEGLPNVHRRFHWFKLNPGHWKSGKGVRIPSVPLTNGKILYIRQILHSQADGRAWFPDPENLHLGKGDIP